MERYYIFCSNNQAYHSLINNSIMAKAVTKSDFQSDTAGFLTNDYIFVTKEKPTIELIAMGIPDEYYPVILEIEDTEQESKIPARLVCADSEGRPVLREESVLSDYAITDNCVGAFVMGDIPITYVCGILFDTEEHRVSFKKSSLDLWFPEELFDIWQPLSEDSQLSVLTEDFLKDISSEVDKIISDEEVKAIERQVLNRTRKKAAAYFAVEGTENWNAGVLKTNLDASLIKFIDGAGDLLQTEMGKVLEALGKSDDLSIEDYMKRTDPVFDAEAEGINKRLFDIIVSTIMSKTEVRDKISEDTFNEIGRACIDAGDDKGEISKAFMTLLNYLKSTMDPDKALEAMGQYDVLRSFMLFIDQQNNADFLRRAATKLSQNERRYAYIMFGILNGMSEVERSRKSNRELEYRLEEILYADVDSPHLIKSVLPKADATFMKDLHKDGAIYGIIPIADIWYDCSSSQKRLLGMSDEATMEALYKLMVKSVKDDPIPEQDVYAFKKPVTISVQINGKEIETFEIARKKDAKDFGKKIERLLRKEKEVFIVDGFRPYLEDKKRYQKLYRKNQDEIQRLCRKGKS